MNTNKTLSGAQKDKLKSAIITAIIWSAILLFVFMYSVKKFIPKESEVVNMMLVNFGDNRNGSGIEEPANQEGSLAAETSNGQISLSAATTSQQTLGSEGKQDKASEDLLTGNNPDRTIAKSTDKGKTTKKASQAGAKTSSSSTAKKVNTKNQHGDGQGKAAIGNLIRGKGSAKGGQGTGKGTGNSGDPLGGSGYGNSRIGVDRKLISVIPGTMGHGGKQPPHNCSASGTIVLTYTVDHAGNVTSVRRSSGVSDPCIVATSKKWIKQYVKAQRANFSSTGTYKIRF